MINLERTVHADVPLSFGLQNEYDSGNPSYLDTEKGCHSEDACRCANELVHELTESKKRTGRQSAAPS